MRFIVLGFIGNFLLSSVSFSGEKADFLNSYFESSNTDASLLEVSSDPSNWDPSQVHWLAQDISMATRSVYYDAEREANEPNADYRKRMAVSQIRWLEFDADRFLNVVRWEPEDRESTRGDYQTLKNQFDRTDTEVRFARFGWQVQSRWDQIRMNMNRLDYYYW